MEGSYRNLKGDKDVGILEDGPSVSRAPSSSDRLTSLLGWVSYRRCQKSRRLIAGSKTKKTRLTGKQATWYCVICGSLQRRSWSLRRKWQETVYAPLTEKVGPRGPHPDRSLDH